MLSTQICGYVNVSVFQTYRYRKWHIVFVGCRRSGFVCRSVSENSIRCGGRADYMHLSSCRWRFDTNVFAVAVGVVVAAELVWLIHQDPSVLQMSAMTTNMNGVKVHDAVHKCNYIFTFLFIVSLTSQWCLLIIQCTLLIGIIIIIALISAVRNLRLFSSRHVVLSKLTHNIIRYSAG